MRGLVPDATLALPIDVYPIKVTAALSSPLARIADDVPLWGWLTGVLAGAWQTVSADTFTRLLFLILVAASADYLFGVKSAKHRGVYDPRIAHGGAIGKVAGLVLVLLLRGIEGWLLLSDFVDSRGAIATTVGVALLSVDLQSIAHHREALGAPPVPVLSHALAWLRGLTTPKTVLPGPPDSEEGPPS